MKNLSIREARASLTQLEKLLAREGMLIITKRGKPVARILPMQQPRKMVSRKALRDSMPFMKIPSEVLIREDRDGRG